MSKRALGTTVAEKDMTTIAPRPKRAKRGSTLAHATPSYLIQAMTEAKKMKKDTPAASLVTFLPDLWPILFQRATTIVDEPHGANDDILHPADEAQYVVRLLTMVNKALAATMAQFHKPNPLDSERPLVHWWFWIGGHRTTILKDKELAATSRPGYSANLILLLRSVYDGGNAEDEGFGRVLGSEATREFVAGVVTYGRLDLFRLLKSHLKTSDTIRDDVVRMATIYGHLNILATAAT